MMKNVSGDYLHLKKVTKTDLIFRAKLLKGCCETIKKIENYIKIVNYHIGKL